METYFIKSSRFSSILLTWTVAGFLRMTDPSSRFISTKPPFSATYNADMSKYYKTKYKTHLQLKKKYI